MNRMGKTIWSGWIPSEEMGLPHSYEYSGMNLKTYVTFPADYQEDEVEKETD